MKIVIDIPDDEYKILMEAEGSFRTRPVMHIQNGTALPKGHGRLVDVSDLLISLMKYMDGDKSLGQCIDDTPTVIEASELRE